MQPNFTKPSLNMRIDGLDVARGTALIAMATYHFSWDLELFGYLSAGAASSGFLKLYARIIASSFLFMVGFSLVLATQNQIKWRPFLIRLSQVGAAALMISVATYYTMPDGWIFFGILHHIVLASLIGLIFVRLHWVVALLAAVAAFALPQMDLIVTQSPWLNFIGFYTVQPNSNDFVPLFPWLSASLAGIGAAKLAAAFGWIETLARPKASTSPARQLKFLGQHSLIFYIVHQPVLIGAVWIASQIMPPQLSAVGPQFQKQCQAVCENQFNENQCKIYCQCFEIELSDNAAQWSQLAAENKSRAISEVCSRKM